MITDKDVIMNNKKKQNQVYAVMDLNTGFVYATFTNRKKADKMMNEFQKLDKLHGTISEANYGVRIEE